MFPPYSQSLYHKALPTEIAEAAIIDGLGYFGILVRIVLPLSGAALATIGLYTAVFFWNDWFHALIYLNGSQYPVMLLLHNIVNGSTKIVSRGGAARTPPCRSRSSPPSYSSRRFQSCCSIRSCRGILSWA